MFATNHVKRPCHSRKKVLPVKQPKWLFYAIVACAAVIGGALGGFSMHWSRLPAFPLYGLTLDLIGIPVVIGLVLYARRLKKATSDEFSVAKKRYAIQTAFLSGAVLYMLCGVLTVFLPQPYHAFITSLGDPQDAFEVGRLAGFAPFVMGLVIGQIASWMKYG